ncbi:MAG: hypothetical protein MJ113_02040 [Lachnospiraceae bacterium]|nr:hypothetical protein [Lachnospiraceae bacterium]
MKTVEKSEKKFNKRLAFILIVFASIFSFACCSNENVFNNTRDEWQWEEGDVIRVGNRHVGKKELAIYFGEICKEYTSRYGDAVWDYVLSEDGETIGESLSKQLLERIIVIKLLCEKADEERILLSEADLKEADEKTKKYLEMVSSSELKMFGFDDSVIRNLYKDNLLAIKAYNEINIDELIKEDGTDFSRKAYLCIYKRKFSIEEDGSHKRFEAGEIVGLEEGLRKTLDKLKGDWGDKEALMEYENERPKLFKQILKKGDLPSEYEESVWNLKTGDYSGIISTADYYMLYYCVSDDYEEAVLKARNEWLTEQRRILLDKLCEEWKKDTVIEIREDVLREAVKLSGDMLRYLKVHRETAAGG